MRIGRRLGLWSAAGVIVIVAVVGYMAYRTAAASLRRQVYAHLESVAQSRAAHLETYLEEHEASVRLAATSWIVRQGLGKLQGAGPHPDSIVRELNLRLKDYLDPHGHIEEVFLLNRKGTVVASSTRERIGLDRQEDAYFVSAKAGTFIKDVHHSKTIGKDSFVISTPVRDSAGSNFLGIVAVRVSLAGLNSIVTDNTGLGETGECYLINKNSFMITSSRFVENVVLKQKVDTKNASKCLTDMAAMRAGRLREGHEEEAAVFADYRGVWVLGTHAHVHNMEWGLLAEIDANEAFAPVAGLRKGLFIGGAILAGIALLLAHFFARRISRPIHELHVGSERIGGGDLSYRLDIRTGDEIQQLADEFNRMAAQLSESYASLEHKVAERTAELQRSNRDLEEFT